MRKKVEIFIFSLAAIIGIVVFIVFISLGSTKKLPEAARRPMETYYYSRAGSSAEIDIATNEEIDVNNCYAILDEEEYIKLSYKGFDGLYNFEFSRSSIKDFNFTGLSIKDIHGNTINLRQFTEVEEVAREKSEEDFEDKKETYNGLSSVGFVISIIAIVVLAKLLKDKNTEQAFEPIVVDEHTNEKFRVCEYCGHRSDINARKCERCGADFKFTKKD